MRSLQTSLQGGRGIVISDVLPGHFNHSMVSTLIFPIVYVGYRTDVVKANLYGSKA